MSWYLNNILLGSSFQLLVKRVGSLACGRNGYRGPFYLTIAQKKCIKSRGSSKVLKIEKPLSCKWYFQHFLHYFTCKFQKWLFWTRVFHVFLEHFYELYFAEPAFLLKFESLVFHVFAPFGPRFLRTFGQFLKKFNFLVKTPKTWDSRFGDFQHFAEKHR